MAISLSSNHPPFHALLEDPAKSTKNSTAETLLAIAERKGEGSMASNGDFAAFTGAHTGRSPKDSSFSWMTKRGGRWPGEKLTRPCNQRFLIALRNDSSAI